MYDEKVKIHNLAPSRLTFTCIPVCVGTVLLNLKKLSSRVFTQSFCSGGIERLSHTPKDISKPGYIHIYIYFSIYFIYKLKRLGQG